MSTSNASEGQWSTSNGRAAAWAASRWAAAEPGPKAGAMAPGGAEAEGTGAAVVGGDEDDLCGAEGRANAGDILGSGAREIGREDQGGAGVPDGLGAQGGGDGAVVVVAAVIEAGDVEAGGDVVVGGVGGDEEERAVVGGADGSEHVREHGADEGGPGAVVVYASEAGLRFGERLQGDDDGGHDAAASRTARARAVRRSTEVIIVSVTETRRPSASMAGACSASTASRTKVSTRRA
ncbi:MAG: hypothetical protein R3B59_09315 [Dehalococcoidia bacterium]